MSKRLLSLGSLGAALVSVGFFGLLFGGITSSMKGSPEYQQGVARAVGDPGAQAAMGTPIVPSWIVTGKTSSSTGTSSAKLSVPLEGPTRNGTLTIRAHRFGEGPVEFDELWLSIDGAATIDLLVPVAER